MISLKLFYIHMNEIISSRRFVNTDEDDNYVYLYG